MYGWENVCSRFLYHQPCTACGSKDNFARYEGGSGFCFGCGHFERGTGVATFRVDSSLAKSVAGSRGNTEAGLRPPPDDTECGGYPELVIEWVAKYGLTVVDLIRYKIGWSKKREQLIYQFHGADEDLVLWQARNFREGTSHKDRFFTGGSAANVVAAYYPRQSGSTACIVEDCISAIKCSQAGVVGIPCLGSAMPEKKLTQISKMYKNVFVWLDSDKFKEAQKIGTQLGMLGCRTKVLYSDLDPKEYALDYLEAKFG